MQRIFAAFTAVAVLMMSIDCACAGGMSFTSQAGDGHADDQGSTMPCCAHHQGTAHHCRHESGDPHKRRPNPCNGECEHCGQTVINDTVAVPPHGGSFSLHAVTPIHAIGSTAFCASDLHLHRSAPTSADLPPPITSPTLLSLHCALTD